VSNKHVFAYTYICVSRYQFRLKTTCVFHSFLSKTRVTYTRFFSIMPFDKGLRFNIPQCFLRWSAATAEFRRPRPQRCRHRKHLWHCGPKWGSIASIVRGLEASHKYMHAHGLEHKGVVIGSTCGITYPRQGIRVVLCHLAVLVKVAKLSIRTGFI